MSGYWSGPSKGTPEWRQLLHYGSMSAGNRVRTERRPRRSLRGCLLLGACLLLAACGSTATGTFHPGGGVSTPPASSSPPTARSASDASKLGPGGLEWPPFGSNAHVDVAAYKAPSKTQRQAVIAQEDFMLAYEYGLYSGGRDARWEAYVVPSERKGIADLFASGSVRAESFTGTVRIWRVSSEPSGGGSVQVSDCIDTYATKNTDYSTGKVLPASKQGTADENYYLEIDVLARQHGRWQITRIEQAIYYPNILAVACKP
jgi:hypothetical protein